MVHQWLVRNQNKVTLIESLWCWYSNSQIIYWTKIWNPELDPRIYERFSQNRVEFNSVEKDVNLAYLKEKEKSQINKLTLHLKEPEKEQVKPKIRRKEIINI